MAFWSDGEDDPLALTICPCSDTFLGEVCLLFLGEDLIWSFHPLG
jgi:hypothetical protein